MDRPSKPVERLETSDAPEMDEEQVEQLFVAALQEIDKGNWQSGEKSLLKILAQDDENIEALRELAMLNLLDKKNPMAAKDYFQRAFSLDPNDTGVMNELLRLYEEVEPKTRIDISKVDTRRKRQLLPLITVLLRP